MFRGAVAPMRRGQLCSRGKGRSFTFTALCRQNLTSLLGAGRRRTEGSKAKGSWGFAVC
jgi:hypothetical protein